MMTTLPHALVEHRAELDRRIDSFDDDILAMEEELRAMRENRDVAIAERRGIDKAVEVLIGDGVDKAPAPVERAPRRDIKALAAAEIAQTPGWPGMSQDERVRYLCKQLRCKPSQAEAAMRGHIQLSDGSMI